MKKLLLLLVLCGGVGLITYLLHRENPIAEKMKALYGVKVSLPVEGMLLVSPDSRESTFCEDAKYKVLVFYDSLSCSPCVYKNMYIWNDFIEEACKANGKVQFLFIMNPSQKNIKDLFHTIQTPNGFLESLFIDTIGVFADENKFLPIEQLYHCMLLDAENKIKLIGDPTRNNHLRELYLNTISN